MYSEGLLLEMLTAEKKGNYEKKGNIILVYETGRKAGRVVYVLGQS